MITTGVWGVTDMQWLQARDADSILRRIAPMTMNYLALMSAMGHILVEPDPPVLLFTLIVTRFLQGM